MTRALGIDIGTSHIRIAEIESHGRKRRLLGLYELARDSQMTPGLQIRSFFESSGLVADRIGMGSGVNPLMIRTFEFPFSNLKKVEGAVQAEFEDTLPFDISDHALEVRPMGKIGKINRYIGGLMPKTSLEALDRISEEAGVIINSYYADSEALAELALNQNLPAANADVYYAVCDFGHATTKIAFLRGSRPKFLNKKAKEDPQAQIVELRTIDRGGQELVQWIKEKNVLSEEDALQWLIHRAEIRVEEEGTHTLTGDISDEIKTALRPVVVELYQTLQAFKSKTGAMPFAVYATGGLSGLKGFREFLAQELHVPFHAWPIFEGFETHNMPLTIEKERNFGVALAIAHRWSYTASEGWLNFKHATAQKKFLSSFIASFSKPEMKRVAWGLSFALIALVIYSMVGAVFLGRQSARMETDMIAEFRRIDRELGKQAQKFAKNPTRAQEIFRKEKKKKLAEEAAKGSKAPLSRARAEVLLDISEALPSGSVLKKVGIQAADQGISMESRYKVATAPTQEELKRAWESLSQNLGRKGYTDVGLESSPNDKALLVLKAKWKGGPQ